MAADVHTRTTLDGTPLPARLPATASALCSCEIALRHVEVIGRVLPTDAAGRLSPEQWAIEAQLAVNAARLNPSELQALGTALVALLDQDGAEPDDHTPARVDELRLTRHAYGGSIKGRFDDPALYDAIAAVIDAKSAPLTADDDRSGPQRQAEAPADICGYVLDHGDLPDTDGHRPLLTVTVRLEDLVNRARLLEFGGSLTPAALRTLACDAAVLAVVMNGAGEPLDIGRATHIIPDGLRRAVTARDRACAHPACAHPACDRPACDRPPSWSDQTPGATSSPTSLRPDPARDHQGWCEAAISDRLAPLLAIMTPARPEIRPTRPRPALTPPLNPPIKGRWSLVDHPSRPSPLDHRTGGANGDDGGTSAGRARRADRAGRAHAGRR